MNYRDQVKQCKLEHPDWGRRRISQETGISEKRVRGILSELKPSDEGIRSIRHLGDQSIIEAVIHLKDVNDKEEILRACKLDPTKWDCVDAMVKAWQMGSKDAAGKPQVTDLYSVSVKARPKQGFDLDACLEKIKRIDIKPIDIAPREPSGHGMLEVFLTDMHFGISDYYGLATRVMRYAESVEEVVFIIGSDGLHADNVKGTTVYGTQLEPIDLNRAWEDMYTLYYQMIRRSLEIGKKTVVKYLSGNHDATTGWTVVKALEKVLPGAEYDTDLINKYKAHRYGWVGIGWTHGDKGKRNDYDRLFLKRYPAVFRDARCVEIHYGHIHQESVKDSYGNMMRSLPTGTEKSGWTDENGYESAQRFQLFEYSEDELRAIYYV